MNAATRRQATARFGVVVALLLGVIAVSGCGPSYSARARHGIAYYCPGAGNIDFGDGGIREGLQAAGYRGEVASVMWTVSLNPAIDQALKIPARSGGERLARTIEQYLDEYPGRPVTLIGLSAGTGVALFACESLRPGYSVENVILLSGSVSHDYDVRRALRRIDGKIYNFYSSRDAVLAGPMKVFGTIDGKLGKEGAGAVGLTPPTDRERVVNIAYRREWSRYGYYGGHTDVTAAAFVEHHIAPLVAEARVIKPQRANAASRLAQAVLDAHARRDRR